jgi:hypothetical protein
MTNQELKEIRERLEAATPGPWFWTHFGDVLETHGARILSPTFDGQLKGESEDKEFIAHAPEDIRRLLDAYVLKESEYQATITKLNKVTQEALRRGKEIERLQKELQQAYERGKRDEFLESFGNS